jgi:preprotein translocase subunit SecA
VRIKEESQTLATVTLQNFFKLYRKLGGMTGTAMTEANEFWKIYKLDVVAIPPNRGLQRVNHPDVIYRTEREKWIAVADEVVFEAKESRDRESILRTRIKEIQRRGLPVLVGTVSIEKSERLSGLLEKRGIDHQVLNAKHHKREAEIIAQAGRRGAVTIATNMAGRGTDIILGGNPDTLAWARLQDTYPTRLDVPKQEWDALVAEIAARENMKVEGQQVREMGGLQIIGTERHEARRIDLQLRGRCGRQGDPGSSRFFLSLEDDLMRIFAGEWVKSVLTRLGMQDGEAIESRMVTRRVEAAQKKVEERNFEVRKNLLEYDEVMDEQRKRVYGFRQRILDFTDGDADCREMILEMVDHEIDRHVGTFLDKDYGAQTFATWASSQLACELDPTDFRGMTAAEAERLATDEAVRQSESQIFEAVEENLPSGEDESEWNWAALATFANARWKVSVNDRDLKRAGRDGVAELLQEKARAAIGRIDLAEGARFLDPEFGFRSACGWTEWRFGVRLTPDDVAALERVATDVDAFRRLVREKARSAYEAREVEYPVMVGVAHFSGRLPDGSRGIDLGGLLAWARERFGAEIDPAALPAGDLEALKAVLVDASRRRHARGDDPRDEMKRMERAVLLQILDNSWKDHLLAMDHLRASVGLRGYAQVDPKVEYKREGMRTFDLMWKGIEERVVDIVYRIEQVEDEALRSTWRETAAIHAEAAPAVPAGPAANVDAVQESGSEPAAAEPIRNVGRKVGRNDPCPCGSGRKFKNCCGKSSGVAAG